MLEEVVQARRATICEEEITPKDLVNSPDVENVQNINETTFVDEEKELVMAFNLLTLKYKDKRLEESFSAHIGPHSLLIVEVLLAIVSLLLIYLYFPIRIRTSILLGILIGLKLIFTLILLHFHRVLLNWWFVRHLIASFYLFSPLLIILFEYPDYYPMSLPVFILYISTYLTLGASISHLMKILIAILSISIYLPLIIFSKSISSLFRLNLSSMIVFLLLLLVVVLVDIAVCLIISLIVLYGIARQIEIARRSQYHVVHKSSEQRIEIEKERERADWLLKNILPEHVIEPLRNLRGTYSFNHPCVGVLFASLTNFHVMYEEQYEGGKYYARILNEFYGDIEELFLNPRFSKIEKIKTIGSTFMAASGLRTDTTNDPQSLGKKNYIETFFLYSRNPNIDV